MATSNNLVPLTRTCCHTSTIKTFPTQKTELALCILTLIVARATQENRPKKLALSPSPSSRKNANQLKSYFNKRWHSQFCKCYLIIARGQDRNLNDHENALAKPTGLFNAAKCTQEVRPMSYYSYTENLHTTARYGCTCPNDDVHAFINNSGLFSPIGQWVFNPSSAG